MTIKFPDEDEYTPHVDFEDRIGFNSVYWTKRVLSEGPILLEPASRAFWAYSNGVWRVYRDVVADRLPRMIGKSFRTKHVKMVEVQLTSALVHSQAFIYPDRPVERYLSLPTGLFDLETGETIPHRADVHSTYQLQVIPEFDTPTPEFDRFLKSVLHDGDADRVLDLLAYMIRPGNPLQKAVMLSGAGRNGKGVLMRLVESLLGKHNVAAVSLKELSGPFAVKDLWGKPLNMVGDIDGDHIEATGTFKQVTGGDLMRMNAKYAQEWTAHVWAVPVFSANIIPTSSDTSHGYLRRWEVVEFPNTFDGKDADLEDRLHAELPAIAGKLLTHAVAVGVSIRESEPGRRAHDVFAQKSDPVRSWLAETDLSGFVKRGDAYAAYKFWILDDNGKTPLTKGRFFDRMRAVLGPEVKRQGHHGWNVDPKTSPSEPKTSPKIGKTSPRLPPDSDPFRTLTSNDADEGEEGEVLSDLTHVITQPHGASQKPPLTCGNAPSNHDSASWKPSESTFPQVDPFLSAEVAAPDPFRETDR